MRKEGDLVVKNGGAVVSWIGKLRRGGPGRGCHLYPTASVLQYVSRIGYCNVVLEFPVGMVQYLDDAVFLSSLVFFNEFNRAHTW